MPPPRPRRLLVLLGWGLAWIAATVASLLVVARPDAGTADGDEVYWIGSAYYFHLAFVDAHWTHPDWTLLPARENPPVAKYVLGLGLAAAGQPVTSPDLLGSFYLMYERIPGAWGGGADHAKRAAVAGRVNPELRQELRAGAPAPLGAARLGAARRVTMACGILTGLLLFFLGWAGHGPLAGLLASQFWFLHPAVSHARNHAHADSIALLFATAAAMAAYHFARRAAAEAGPARGAQFASALGLGVLIGLACGAKLNAVVVAGLAGAVMAFSARAAWRHSRERGRQTVVAGGIVLAMAIGVFVALNPAVWVDLPDSLLASVKEHRATEQLQARFVGGHLVTLPAKAGALAQLAAAGVLPLAALTLLALGALAARHPGLRFAAAWYLLGLVCVALWIPFAFGRYALPVILPGALLTGMLAATLAAAAGRRLGLTDTPVVRV